MVKSSITNSDALAGSGTWLIVLLAMAISAIPHTCAGQGTPFKLCRTRSGGRASGSQEHSDAGPKTSRPSQPPPVQRPTYVDVSVSYRGWPRCYWCIRDGSISDNGSIRD